MHPPARLVYHEIYNHFAMSIASGRNVGKSFGAFDVFSGLSFQVARGDKIALVGPNGCGKTTLLRLIAGEDQPTEGDIHIARGVIRGYLAQDAEDADERTVWALALSAFAELNALQQRMAQLEATLASLDQRHPDALRLLEAYGELQQAFELKGGYTVEARIKRVLAGLGLAEPTWHQPTRALSGGQRVRANLARLLLQSPDLLLLDEPTNHLDQAGVEWLEAYLQDWAGALIVISHDRYFLDEVCDRVWELRRQANGQAALSFYRGGYTEYVQQRAERQAQALAEYEAQQASIAKAEEYIRRNLAGQNAAQARGRLRRLNRLERLEKPAQQRALALRLLSNDRSSDRVLAARDLKVGYRADGALRALFHVPELLLLRGERVAVVGPNGSGKTTLLKTLIGELSPLGGQVTLGAGVRVGYFAQAGEGLNPEHTVLEALLAACRDLKHGEARSVLGQFLFSGDDHFKQVRMLSGGERARLALARLALQGANLLLLDEPTNHLDIPAQEALTEALQHFDGTLLFVSHDRYLIAALATQLWVVEPAAGQLVVFKGGYDQWREARELAGAATPAAEPAKPSVRPGHAPALSKNAQQRRQAALESVEQRIHALEARLTALSQQMEQAGGDYARLQALGLEYQEAEQALAAAWAEFEQLAG